MTEEGKFSNDMGGVSFLIFVVRNPGVGKHFRFPPENCGNDREG